MSVLIGLGSNLQDPQQQVNKALQALATLPRCRLLHHSDLYRSAPVGPADQPDFINAIAEIETTLVPLALLDTLQSVEHAAGRKRRRHWGERTLDLDILLWDDRRMSLPRLTIPHPEITRRAFVLRPLLDCLPYSHLPDGTALVDYWPQVADQPLERLYCLKEDRFAD